MGLKQKTEYNKRFHKSRREWGEIIPKGWLLCYGVVRIQYVDVSGSVAKKKFVG